MFSEVLRIRGVVPVYLSSILGRLPIGALALLFVLLAEERTGSFGIGGMVAAAEAIGAAVVAPVLGRAVDRLGQARVLVPAALVCSAATGAFAALPDGTPVVVFVAVAAVAGASLPPLAACQRTLWSVAVQPRLRHTIYALDAAAVELVFIAGPLLVVGVIGAWSLRAAVAFCSVVTLVGTLAFAATRLSRDWRPVGLPGPRDLIGPLRGAGVRTVLLALALSGVAISPTEIGVAAFARTHGGGSLVGILLAFWAFGSMIGAVVFGRRPPPRDPTKRLGWMLGALAALSVGPVLAPTPVLMAVALFAAGAFLAPSMALSFATLSAVAPAGTETEAQTWATTAIGIGVASGAAGAGWLVDHSGSAAALAVGPAAVLAAAAVVFLAQRTLRQPAPA